MTKQRLLSFLLGGVLLGCGSADGRALYREFGEMKANSDQTFLDAQDSPAGELTGPVTDEPSIEGEPPISSDGSDGLDTPVPSELDGDDTDDGDSDDDGDVTTPEAVLDEVAPLIEWTAPANGASGVTSNAEIVVKFSEPMDRAATEAAVTNDLGSEVTFSWSDEDTALHIAPAAGLAYASGTEPVSARSYNIGVGAGALDLAGNALEPGTLSFSTLRRVRVELAPVADTALTLAWSSDNAQSDCAGHALCAGDRSSAGGPSGDVQSKAFLSFDLSALPSNLVTLEAASIKVAASSSLGDPFAGLGELHIERAAFESVSQAAFDADPEATLAVMSSAAPVTTGNIRWVVQAGLEGSKLSQYRLTFNQITDGDDDDDLVTFEPENQILSIAYLVP